MKASCSKKKKRKGKTFTLEEFYLNLQRPESVVSLPLSPALPYSNEIYKPTHYYYLL